MIAYRVVAVPERADRAQRLADQVGGTVILDAKHVGAFATHLRALRSATDGSHVVVLEDDAILCGDFTEHVTRLIAERPRHLLGLYVGRQFPQRRQPLIGRLVADAPRWLDDAELTGDLRWAVGYAMPTTDIPAVLAELGTRSQHAWLDTDKRIGRWHASRGLLSYPYPSPVDHDDETPSITSTHRRGRVAWAHCERAVR